MYGLRIVSYDKNWKIIIIWREPDNMLEWIQQIKDAREMNQNPCNNYKIVDINSELGFFHKIWLKLTGVL